MSIAANIRHRRATEASLVPIGTRADEDDAEQICSRIPLGRKRQDVIPSVTTWKDLEGIKLNDVSQSEKDKQPVISFPCGSEQRK